MELFAAFVAAAWIVVFGFVVIIVHGLALQSELGLRNAELFEVGDGEFALGGVVGFEGGIVSTGVHVANLFSEFLAFVDELMVFGVVCLLFVEVCIAPGLKFVAFLLEFGGEFARIAADVHVEFVQYCFVCLIELECLYARFDVGECLFELRVFAGKVLLVVDGFGAVVGDFWGRGHEVRLCRECLAGGGDDIFEGVLPEFVEIGDDRAALVVGRECFAVWEF